MSLRKWFRAIGFFRPKPKDNWHHLQENLGFCFCSRFYDVKKMKPSRCTGGPLYMTAKTVNTKENVFFKIKATFHGYDHTVMTEVWKKPLVDLKAPWVYVGQGSIHMGYNECPSKKTQEVMRSIQKVVDGGDNKTLPR